MRPRWEDVTPQASSPPHGSAASSSVSGVLSSSRSGAGQGGQSTGARVNLSHLAWEAVIHRLECGPVALTWGRERPACQVPPPPASTRSPPLLAMESTASSSQAQDGRNLQAKGSLAVVSWGLQTPISCRGSQASLGSGVHTRGQGGSKDVAERRQGPPGQLAGSEGLAQSGGK